jgi:hypothetical protein
MALAVGETMVGIAPVAQAQSCGLRYVEGSNRPDKNAVLIANGMTCERARAIFDDWFGGKGTQTARNASTVDGYDCVGNPGGVYGNRAHPFVWTKTADEILKKANRPTTSNTGH